MGEAILMIVFLLSLCLYILGGFTEATEATLLGFIGIVITSIFLFIV